MGSHRQSLMAKPKRNSQPDVFRAINALRRMVRGLRSAAESVERELRISAAQLFVLSELAQVPDQSVKELGDLAQYEQLRSEEHTSELQSPYELVCRLLLEKTNLQPPT